MNAHRYLMLSSDKTVQQTELLILVSGRSNLQLSQINLFHLIIPIIYLRMCCIIYNVCQLMNKQTLCHNLC